MKAKVNVIQIVFAVLCILSGVAFGGLAFLAPAPTSQAARVFGPPYAEGWRDLAKRSQAESPGTLADAGGEQFVHGALSIKIDPTCSFPWTIGRGRA